MRLRGAVVLAAIALVATALTAGASTGTSVTPAVAVGSGLGFDICTAPSIPVLKAWSASPYKSINIYFGGSQRGCPNQPNLNADWVTTALANGWSLIPTYVDLQAPQPCYGGSSKSSMSSDPAQATAQGTSAGQDAVTQLQNLGLSTGVSYLDLEPFDVSKSSSCAPAVLAFVDAYDATLKAAGYQAGVYVNAKHGAQTFVSDYFSDANRPDDIWVADWDNAAPAQPPSSDPVLANDWPGHSIRQYYSDDNSQDTGGAAPESYGGESMSIDRDAIDGDVVTASSVTLPSSSPYAYNVIGASSTGLNERSMPTSANGSSNITGNDQDGAQLAIQCQAAGQTVDGDDVWDKLSDDNYVDDLYATTTGRNGFSNAIPKCDTTPPTVTMNALPVATTATAVTATWVATDPPNGNGEVVGVASSSVRYEQSTYSATFAGWHTLTTTTGRSASIPLVAGTDTCVEVRATDRSGNVSNWSSATCVARALDDRSLSASSPWRRGTNSSYYLQTYTSTSGSGAAVTRTKASLDRVGIVATTCSTCGSVNVFVGSTLIGTINLHATSTHYQQLLTLKPFSLRNGTVLLRTRSRALVAIDGLVISRT